MKAIVIPRRGGAFEMVERPVPTPSADQVLIKVEACGICHGETVAIEGHMPGINYPVVPGHEIIGLVEKVGANVSAWKAGQRVGVGWSAGGQQVTGLSVDGGYAEYAVANTAALISIPEGISSTEAAPLMCAGVTTFTALRSSKARMGDLVAIQGIGGLGHLAIQFAVKAGFRTVAISRGKQKQALAKELGAHRYIDSEKEDLGKALKALGGARVVLATAPNAAAISSALGGLARDGEVVIVAGSGEKLDVSGLQLLITRNAIRGWVGDGGADIADTVRFSMLTGVKTRIETFPLERASEAFESMMKSTVRFRAVLKIG